MVDVNPAQHQSSSPSRMSSDLPSGGDTSSSEAPATLPQETTQSFPIASPQRQPQLANSVYELNKQREIIKILHKCAFSPCKSTWITAIRSGFFQSWPGLSTKLVEKHLQTTPGNSKGSHATTEDEYQKHETQTHTRNTSESSRNDFFNRRTRALADLQGKYA